MNASEIAIIVFTYGRLDHTKITLEFLSANKGFSNHPVIIYSDGPKTGHEEKVESVREFLIEFQKKNRNVNIVEREENFGLEKSIITGISEALNKYPAVIAIEDDIRTSSSFLKYMRLSLTKYSDNKEIGGISGYNSPRDRMKIPESYQYDIYFAPRTCSWGWATWSDRWDNIDWDVKDIDSFIKDKKKQREFNKGGNDLSRMLINQAKKGIDTWDIQWCYHNFKKNRFTIYPTISYVENIGMDGTGIHCGKTTGYQNDSLNRNENIKLPSEVVLDKEVLKNFHKAQSLTLKMYAELIFDRGIKILKSFFKQ